MTSVVVRAATEGDLPAILEMRRESFDYGRLADVVGPFDVEHFRKVFTMAIGHPTAWLLLAEADGAPAGTSFGILTDVWLAPDLKSAVEGFIWVRPECRGLGVGGRIVDAIETWAREHKAQFVAMYSYPNLDPESMRGMCRKLGYVEMETNFMRRVDRCR